MERKIDIVFNSEKDSSEKCYPLASGYISQTTVHFEKENLIALIEAKGSVEFYNMEGELVAKGNAPEKNSGKGLYEDVRFQVENNLIKLHFPVYEWIDNYPNCDGEHDRWDTKIIGYNVLTLDTRTYSVS
ncbi:MAG: hypothetical protein IJ262_09240 [Clostridia bacterium]|nr:hypothetical protein [Clostridia bacterium]